ncbi:gamma-interferon-inducible lysosomal thiol reductase-like [Durio zibethinus]|uniref:Gamma-interferon-inducible lysosomal thiol reductase-like n=1 Tax=Durio zibethinus TaxID=66656 RepID=A0A6P6AN55_DURZI|nr:gamma-interferon-inducible lysosomal thiol reductase-like [Durio zibethinus]
MASLRLFTSLLLLLLFISTYNAQNVTLSVYYETLCPYCADFIVNHLVKLFDKGLISIVNLRLVPWGNAVMQRDGTFGCQHGPDECLLNAIEACTIIIYPNVEWHFRFILCVERLTLENKLNEWVNCFDMTRLGTVPIDCYKSGYGNVLEKQYAAETTQLNPPHKFVPWVLVNGQPLQEDFKNFASYVCKAYQGERVPEACQSLPLLPLTNNSLKKATLSNSVCYAKRKTRKP